MSEMATAPAGESSAADESSGDHFVCCEASDCSAVRTLCGLATTYDGVADVVDCVVCADLDRNDWCPRYGRCPYGGDGS